VIVHSVDIDGIVDHRYLNSFRNLLCLIKKKKKKIWKDFVVDHSRNIRAKFAVKCVQKGIFSNIVNFARDHSSIHWLFMKDLHWISSFFCCCFLKKPFY